MTLKVRRSRKKSITTRHAIAAAGIALMLSGCVHVPKGELAEASYFPPLGLGQEAAALDTRRSKLYPRHTAHHTAPVANTEVPLDEVVFEDAAAFQAHSNPGLPTSYTSVAPFRGVSYTALTRH